MKKGATNEEVKGICKEVESAGMRPHLNVGEERIVVACIGSIDTQKTELIKHFRTLPGVEDSQLISPPYKLGAKSSHPGEYSFPINGVSVGSKQILIIAGPCSVETPSLFFEVACALKILGAHVLRGMLFKPRTDPYSFQGLGVDGAEILVEAKKRYGLPIITEVLSADMIEPIMKCSDIIQIGARNGQNYPLIKAVGESGAPCLFKRGPGVTIIEFLRATEYLLEAGNKKVMMCLRGIKGIDTHFTRNQADLDAIPVLKRETYLPVAYDPSHAAGKKEFVVAQALAAIAMGVDVIEIEVHPDPTKAKSDADQQLTIPEFAEFMERARKVAAAVGRTI